MDFSSLIGLETEKAKEILVKNGYNNIEIIQNAEHNELCDSVLVCSAKESNGKVTLICGEFYLNIKR
jgi:hypothetical protein